MDQFSLRDARVQDQDAIRTVTLAANKEYASIAPAQWVGYRENILHTLADVAPAEQIVAERDGAILGTVLLYPANTVFPMEDGSTFTLQYPEVRLLAVDPPARGQGIGAALVRECIERARFTGAPVLTLHTTDIMQAAMKMYERMGFVRVPQLDFEPTPGFIIKGYRYALTAAARVMINYHGIAILEEGDPFPDPRLGPQDDPVAVGFELTPQLMLAGYRKGLFAWTVNPVTWWSPDPRAILPLNEFHMSKRLARKIRTRPFHVTMDGAFATVVELCAMPRSAENGVWITPEFVGAYLALYHQGYAHSVECWRDERLVGGVFGVAIDGFFAAESMFHVETDASKIALSSLVESLKASGFQLLDIQMLTPHTRSLGAHELSRSQYLSLLEQSLQVRALPLSACTLVKPNGI